jgi:hypothetical protein
LKAARHFGSDVFTPFNNKMAYGVLGRVTDPKKEAEDTLLKVFPDDSGGITKTFSAVKGPYSFTLPEIVENHSSAFTDNIFKELTPELRLLLRVTLQDVLPEHWIAWIKEHYDPVEEAILKLISEPVKMSFIGANRAETKRLYEMKQEGPPIHALLRPYSEQQFKGSNLKPFVNHWLKKFGIADEMRVSSIANVVYEVKLTKKQENGAESTVTRNLADVGYGVSQLIPILLKIATYLPVRYLSGDENLMYQQGWIDQPPQNESFQQRVTKHGMRIDESTYELVITQYDKVFLDYEHEEYETQNIQEIRRIRMSLPASSGNLLAIEEPETSLHPKLQSLLADMLVSAAYRFDGTFLVETHSEYLIRKLQFLVATKAIKPENVAIYYLHDPNEIPEGRKQVERINILPNGLLDNQFGAGFFDESTRLMTSILTGNSQN